MSSSHEWEAADPVCLDCVNVKDRVAKLEASVREAHRALAASYGNAGHAFNVLGAALAKTPTASVSVEENVERCACGKFARAMGSDSCGYCLEDRVAELEADRAQAYAESEFARRAASMQKVDSERKLSSSPCSSDALRPDVGDIVVILYGIRKGDAGTVMSRIPDVGERFSVRLCGEEREMPYLPNELRVVQKAKQRTKEPVVWADEISPFNGAQVKALLEENEALRRQIPREEPCDASAATAEKERSDEPATATPGGDSGLPSASSSSAHAKPAGDERRSVCVHGVTMTRPCMTCISRGDDPRGVDFHRTYGRQCPNEAWVVTWEPPINKGTRARIFHDHAKAAQFVQESLWEQRHEMNVKLLKASDHDDRDTVAVTQCPDSAWPDGEIRKKLRLPTDAPVEQVIAVIDNLQKLAALRTEPARAVSDVDDWTIAAMWIDDMGDKGIIGHYREPDARRELAELIASVRLGACPETPEAPERTSVVTHIVKSIDYWSESGRLTDPEKALVTGTLRALMSEIIRGEHVTPVTGSGAP